MGANVSPVGRSTQPQRRAADVPPATSSIRRPHLSGGTDYISLTSVDSAAGATALSRAQSMDPTIVFISPTIVTRTILLLRSSSDRRLKALGIQICAGVNRTEPMRDSTYWARAFFFRAHSPS